MADFYMMVGLPGSGKTTKADDIVSFLFKCNTNAVRIGTDDIREELFGDASVQTDAAKVFEIALNRVVENLNNGITVVFDATNISSKHRVSFIDNINRKCGSVYNITAVVVNTDFEECRRRNASRDRKVPEEVLYRMLKNFQCPQMYEGFTNISFTESSSTNDLFDEIYSMNGFDQKNPHHKYDLLEHCRRVANQFSHNDPRRLAGYLHDIGKMYTQSIDADGVAHYYGHENVGAYRLVSMYEEFKIFTKQVFLDVIFCVNNHMHIRDIIKSEKAIKKYKALWGEKRFNKLVEFMEADNKASGREE